MKREQTRLRTVERKDERLKQCGYFACIQTRRSQHRRDKDKKIKKTTKLKKNKTTTNINKHKCGN